MVTDKKIKIRVVPMSSTNEIVGAMADGALKIKLMAAPVAGKANAALQKLLADYFKIATSRVSIIRGQKSKTKLVKII